MIDALMLMLPCGSPEHLTRCVDIFQNCGEEVSQGLQGKLLESLTGLPIGTVTVYKYYRTQAYTPRNDTAHRVEGLNEIITNHKFPKDMSIGQSDRHHSSVEVLSIWNGKLTTEANCDIIIAILDKNMN
ncbi:hypothetical protein STEG23_036046 [Scotinomys teguina]